MKKAAARLAEDKENMAIIPATGKFVKQLYSHSEHNIDRYLSWWLPRTCIICRFCRQAAASQLRWAWRSLSVALFELWLIWLFEIFDVLFAQLDFAGCDSLVSGNSLAQYMYATSLNAQRSSSHSFNLAQPNNRHDVLLRQAPRRRDLCHALAHLLTHLL